MCVCVYMCKYICNFKDSLFKNEIVESEDSVWKNP